MSQPDFSELRNLPARLREIRKARGLTQSQFADLGGVGLGAYHRYEAGTSEPGASFLGHLVLAGIDVIYLLSGFRTVSETVGDPGEAELLRMYRQLAIDTKEALTVITGNLAAQPQPGKASPRATLHERESEFRGEDEG